MNIRTTQQNFSAMHGHIADGTQIVMDNGDVLTMYATMHGWDIYRDGQEINRCGSSAHAVESFIFHYVGD